MLNIPHSLKILVVGSGGREHVLCWKLAQSPHVNQIFCAPGNGGTAVENKTKNIPIDALDFKSLSEFCQSEKVDLIVIGPDDPLAQGIVDYLEECNLRVFGPNKNTARLEWSKSYAKEFMTKHSIPTPRYVVCENPEQARQCLKSNPWIRIVKADGLALGKGVFVCSSDKEVEQALSEIFEKKKFGQAGTTVVLEERIVGEELSLLLLCDGKRFILLEASQDHKRRFDGELGPNTGGMGAYSPVPLYTKYKKLIEENVLQPLKQAMDKQALNYKGILYVGIIVGRSAQDVSDKVQVLEFNARFGDPEAQAILPRLACDLLPALWAACEGKLNEAPLTWSKQESCCVVAVTKTYPEKSARGDLITLPILPKDCYIFQSGTKAENGKLVTAGGRILCITALAANLNAAAQKAYAVLNETHFDGIDYRQDIAREKSACR